jgi:diacylglycerol kinase family enzyme
VGLLVRSAPGEPLSAPIPAFINPSAGSAGEVREALAGDARFVVHEVAPNELAAAMLREVRAGARRVLVAGGDGTIASAAGTLAGTGVELAVLPGGTLNHFAGHLSVPTDVRSAVEAAATGVAVPVDAAYVNDRLFINTSSVGVYVAFVRLRDYLERWLGYWAASLVAGVHLFVRRRRYDVAVEVEGVTRHYRTTLLFIGVGERETSAYRFDEHVPGGRKGLHVLVVRGHRAARLLALGLAAVRRGIQGVRESPEVDSFVVDRCSISLHGRRAHLATDGEVTLLRLPLEYRAAHDALSVVLPQEVVARAASAEASAGG